MSSLIFPLIDFSRGVTKALPFKKWPEYSTLKDTPASNRGEFAASLTPFPVWNFELDVPFLPGRLNDPSSPVALVVGFWMQMRGQYDTFLYPDLSDNTVIAPAPMYNAATGLQTGDGSATVFWLLRSVAGGLDLIQNVSDAPKIYINGTLQSSSSYSISGTGAVTFSSAPANGAVPTWTGSFYFRCRFKDDALTDLQMIAPSIWECKTFSFHSVIL